ncbi:hypothetical protein ACFOWE_17280 [Planomonospora corallina]|uniref:Uncharacterized protein n=1 Tax=Planomonospora corallina TaxID=1806052 RepID=A0ABV8I9K8_9ACTN
MDVPYTDRHSERREWTRQEFREAGRELRLAMGWYRGALAGLDARAGSAAEVIRARQAWAWALREWVRTLVAREQAVDEAWADPALGRTHPDPAAVPSSPPGTLEEARRRVELLAARYERIRRGVHPDDVAAARELWARALSAWADRLVEKERAADRAWLYWLDKRDLAGGGPSGRVNASDQQLRVVEESRERFRAANVARARAEAVPPPAGEDSAGGDPRAARPARGPARPERRAG